VSTFLSAFLGRAAGSALPKVIKVVQGKNSDEDNEARRCIAAAIRLALVRVEGDPQVADIIMHNFLQTRVPFELVFPTDLGGHKRFTEEIAKSEWSNSMIYQLRNHQFFDGYLPQYFCFLKSVRRLPMGGTTTGSNSGGQSSNKLG
jgi:hypothetical protein